MTDEKRLRSLDEQIAEALREAERKGELRSARDYGKPIDFGDGYDEAPPELRMAFKVLKDAGIVPPEVAMFRQIAELRRRLAELPAQGEEAMALRQRIAQLEVEVQLRVERLAGRKP